MTSIGERLEAARDRRLWTQEELAQKSSVPVVTISRIENDRYSQRPRISTLRKLAEALSVPVEWLVFGDGEVDEAKKAAA